jgi:hypothetical protein
VETPAAMGGSTVPVSLRPQLLTMQLRDEREGRRGFIPRPRVGLNCQTRYEVETPAAMGGYDQYVLGSQLITMLATRTRQPWWLNESLKCDDGGNFVVVPRFLFHDFSRDQSSPIAT